LSVSVADNHHEENGSFFSILLSCFPIFSPAIAPQGFSWINLESDKETMAAVRRALRNPAITAFREVGVRDGFALVMAVSRDSDAPTPDYDQWSIYNVSLATGKSRKLVSGYGVKLLDWIGSEASELAITYYDCWECEAATLFTTLHFVQGTGWRARWLSEKQKDSEYPHPGAVVFISDAGEPYEENVEVEQVFGVLTTDNRISAASWYHSRNAKTGKIEDQVARYWVDQATGRDQVKELHGQEAQQLQSAICNAKLLMTPPSIGQKSSACIAILKKQPTSGETHGRP
jgi:hypothetical protein